MKSFLVSLLLLVFAQGVKAETVNLDQTISKELYNVLASFGLRFPAPAEKQTDELAHPANCMKVVSTVEYSCKLYDMLHNMNVQKSGLAAKKLYDLIALANPIVCSGDQCYVSSADIRCVYHWPDKYDPPTVRYFCQMDKRTAEPPAPK